MRKENVVKAYFQGLEQGSNQDIIKLFAVDAIVHSPLYSQVEASLLYKELFSDTRSSKTTFKNTFINPENPNTAAARFIYSWVMKEGTQVQFECVDIFDIIPQRDKIQTLTIIYDTYQTRENFEKIRKH